MFSQYTAYGFGSKGAGDTPVVVTPGGANLNIQYNEDGVFGGISGMNYNGVGFDLTTGSGRTSLFPFPDDNSFYFRENAYFDYDIFANRVKIGGVTTPIEALDVFGDAVIQTATNRAGVLTIKTESGTISSQFGSYPEAPLFGGFWAGNITPNGSNYAFIGDGNELTINAVTATYFRVNNESSPSSKMTIRASGVGINTDSPVAPFDSPSAARISALEFNKVSDSNVFMSSNIYYDSGAGFIYRNNGYGSAYQFFNGGFNFYSFPSGTAGASATSTNRFSIDGTTGLVTIPYSATVSGHTFLSDSIDIGVNYNDPSIAFSLDTTKTYAFNFYSSGNILMALGSNGRLGIGLTASSAKLQIRNGVAGDTSIIIDAHAAQSADLIQIRDSDFNVISSMNNQGSLALGGYLAGSRLFVQGINMNSAQFNSGGSGGYGVFINQFSASAGNYALRVDTNEATEAFVVGNNGATLSRNNLSIQTRTDGTKGLVMSSNNNGSSVSMYADNSLNTLVEFLGNSGAIRFDGNNMINLNTGVVGVPYRLAVGAGYSGEASAILDIQSTTAGVLLPRMTTIQRNAISAPAESLMVYDTDIKTPFYFNGTVWVGM